MVKLYSSLNNSVILAKRLNCLNSTNNLLLCVHNTPFMSMYSDMKATGARTDPTDGTIWYRIEQGLEGWGSVVIQVLLLHHEETHTHTHSVLLPAELKLHRSTCTRLLCSLSLSHQLESKSTQSTPLMSSASALLLWLFIVIY